MCTATRPANGRQVSHNVPMGKVVSVWHLASTNVDGIMNDCIDDIDLTDWSTCIIVYIECNDKIEQLDYMY